MASVLLELMCSTDEEGVMESVSFLGFVKRMGRAEALARSTLRMVAVLALVMVAAVRIPEETVAALMKLSARSKRAVGSAL